MHVDFQVTMTTVLELYTQHEPALGVFEQVWGFTMPIEKGSTVTPKQRPGSSGAFCFVTVRPVAFSLGLVTWCY